MLRNVARCLGMTTENYLCDFFIHRPHLKVFGVSLSAENIFPSFTEGHLPA